MEKYIDFKNGIEYDKLKEVAEAINKSGIVIFPTETVYGIGANCFDVTAVNKIYEVKQRPKEKPLSVLVSDFSMIEEVAINISDVERKIWKNFSQVHLQ